MGMIGALKQMEALSVTTTPCTSAGISSCLRGDDVRFSENQICLGRAYSAV